MTHKNLHIIAPQYYFTEHTRFPETHHIRQPWLQKQFKHPYPTQEEIDRFQKSIFPDALLNGLRQNHPSEIVLYNLLQSNVFQDLVKWIEKEIENIGRKAHIEGIFAWRDCASLNKAAQNKGIKVIYNEISPFRNPSYHETFYWDCEGVKKSSELERRFEQVRADKNLRKQYEAWAIRLLPQLFDRAGARGCAVLMACEEDFVFMRGFSNYRLLAYAKDRFPSERIIAR
ncbi:MAG: hypothetical protein LBT71_06650, partial [Azoarcus sp.]|nr:hypothetical protein [Azoarcus sp.]